MNSLLRCEALWVSREEDALTLTASFRFDNEGSISFLVHLASKLLEVSRQHIGIREEVIIVWEDILHSHQVTSEHIFLG